MTPQGQILTAAIAVIVGMMMVIEVAAATVVFISPQNDEAVRSNNGDVNIRIVPSQEFTLTLDGAPVKLLNNEAGDRNLFFRNLDRGTHILEVVTEDGETNTLTFHVLRTHK